MDMVGEFAIIENGVVVNRIVADLPFVESIGVEFSDDADAQIGCSFVEGEWVKS